MIRFLQTPGPAKKIILGGLLLVICVMMVVTLVPGGLFGDYLSGRVSEQGVIAKVNGEPITTDEVRQQAKQLGRQQLGGREVPSQFLSLFMQQAAQQLIMRRIVVDEASRMGLAASDQEIRDFLSHGPFAQQLFPEGNFIGQDKYVSFVQDQFQMPVARFEGMLKDQLTIRKLQSAVTGGVTLGDPELNEAINKTATKVKFDYAVLTLGDVAKAINPTEAELKSFYEQQKQALTNSIPEQRKARYIVIDGSKLPGAQVTQDDLQKYYRQHQEEFRVPEQVNVRHILIKTPDPGPDGKVDPKAVDEARKKAEDILKQLNAGGDFATLAKKYSQDPGSGENGGSLGWISRGVTVPEFEKAAFSTAKGQTSGLVQSSFGFHIIHVDDKHDAHVKSFDEVKPQIEPIVAREKANTETERMARAVEAQARTSGLDKAAADKGLKVTDSGFFARNDALPGIGSSPEFADAVFSQKPNSPATAVRTQQGYAVVQATDVKPPATPTFEQARPQLEQQFKQQRARTLLAQKLQQLSDRARAEHDLKKAAKEVGATVKTSDFVNSRGQVPELGQMAGPPSVIFDMKPGEISGPVEGPGGGSGAVMVLVQKQDPTPEELQKAKDETREALLERKRQTAMELFVSNLNQKWEKSGKIKINDKEMARLSGQSKDTQQ